MIKMNCAFSSSDENFMLSIIYRVISIYTKMNLIVLEQTRNYAFFPKAKNIITKKKKIWISKPKSRSEQHITRKLDVASNDSIFM